MPKFKVTLYYSGENCYTINALTEDEALRQVRRGEGKFWSESGWERNESLDTAEKICPNCWEILEDGICRNPECKAVE
jgi:hypothetical protein